MAEPLLIDVASEDTPEGGVIRLSRWPEGYVLWHHGEIVWRSWDWPRRPAQESVQVVLKLDASGVKAMVDREIAAASMAWERERRSLGRPIRL